MPESFFSCTQKQARCARLTNTVSFSIAQYTALSLWMQHRSIRTQRVINEFLVKFQRQMKRSKKDFIDSVNTTNTHSVISRFKPSLYSSGIIVAVSSGTHHLSLAWNYNFERFVVSCLVIRSSRLFFDLSTFCLETLNASLPPPIPGRDLHLQRRKTSTLPASR